MVDPYNPALPDAYDHDAFYEEGAPWRGPMYDRDTGLRCWCGREVVSDTESPTGWAHVGIGQSSDQEGRLDWERLARATA